MTRDKFIKKWLGNKDYPYTEENRDLMRDDLDEVINQALRIHDVVGRSEQFTCSCGIPPAIRLCEGVETCLKCGEELSK
jgi:hypothetical protein